MYTPKFTITNQILRNIGNIEACKEIIDNAPLIPAWEKRFQEEALERTVHYGTHIEGNELSFTEAIKVMEGQKIIARERDIQEVINYRNVMRFIDELGDSSFAKATEDKVRGSQYTEEQLKKVHSLTCEKILLPHECGQYRKVQVILRNSATGEIVFRPPPHVEVPYLLEGFFEWLNSKEAGEIHPVIKAAIANYVIVDIHPFVEGNGRCSRAYAILVLFVEGYDVKKFFSLEEHFDKDAFAYYDALQMVSKQNAALEVKDLTPWISYYTDCLSTELSAIREKVKRLSVDVKIKGKLGKQVALSEREMKLVEYLEETGEITTQTSKKILPMVSEDTILRDLKDLLKKGIVKKVGSTKAAKYVLK